ncbi:MAG: OsmC family protein [Chloroflexi bacterium]|nr:OsmC family protein [Chloroflexota bacterium]
MSGNWKEINAQWQGGSTFIASNPAGGIAQMGALDGKPGIGPMELVLGAMAGCTGMDVASILLKKRQPLDDLRVQVRGRLAEEYPKIYKEVHVTYLLWGNGLDPNAVEQAIRLSEDKYCSVGIMLRASVPVSSSYRILQPGEVIPEEVEERQK